MGQQLTPEYEALLDSPMFSDLDLDHVSNYRVALPGLGTTALVERTDLVVDGDPPVEIRLHRPYGWHGPSAVVLSIHGAASSLANTTWMTPYSNIGAPNSAWLGFP